MAEHEAAARQRRGAGPYCHLLPRAHLGGTSGALPLCLQRLVHWHAKHHHPHDYRYSDQRGQHRAERGFRQCDGYGGHRSGFRYCHRAVLRTADRYHLPLRQVPLSSHPHPQGYSTAKRQTEAFLLGERRLHDPQHPLGAEHRLFQQPVGQTWRRNAGSQHDPDAVLLHFLLLYRRLCLRW